MADDLERLVAEAEGLKEKGNAAFKEQNFDAAIDSFTAAVKTLEAFTAQSVDATTTPSDDAVVTLLSKCLVNRSLCHASFGAWPASAADARTALQHTPANAKAHYRLIKALLEQEQYRAARAAFAAGFKACGQSLKDWKPLEQELLQRTGLALSPKPTDFEILGELGEGNFTKIYKAMYKPTGRTYAIKVFPIACEDCFLFDLSHASAA